MANPVEQQLAFEKLDAQLAELLDAVGYSELYGYDLQELSGSPKGLLIREHLLNKFLRANKYNIDEAKSQLEKTLKWRKEFNPLSAGFKENHDAELDKLGVVTQADGIVATWNLYGAVDNREELFSKLDQFIRWRVGLMERGISLLDFTKKDANSNYMIQTHDYFGVSFFRLDAATRAASQKTIQLFQDYYPEFVSRKFFVNVPLIMSWMFSLAKTFMSAETAKKLSMLSDGKQLAAEIGNWVPENYGGEKGNTLEGMAVTRFTEPEISKKAGNRQKTEEASKLDAQGDEDENSAVNGEVKKDEKKPEVKEEMELKKEVDV